MHKPLATLVMVVLSAARLAAQNDYSRDELREIFSQPASLTFDGGIEVSTWDFEHEGRTVEALIFRPPGGETRPALLLVPGYRRTAIDYVGNGLRFARAGYVAVAVTQPGFGRSEGPSDWVGPNTIAVLQAARERMAGEELIDASRIGVFGFSRGALAASLLATRPGNELRVAVLCSGLYDFGRALEVYADDGLQGRIKANMLTEAGESAEAIDARTSIDKLEHLTASVLVIHGAEDANVPVELAEELIAALEASGKDFESRIYEGAGHGLPDTGYFDVVLEFLARKL